MAPYGWRTSDEQKLWLRRRSKMLATGRVFEGDDRTFTFACVPSSTAPSTP